MHLVARRLLPALALVAIAACSGGSESAGTRTCHPRNGTNSPSGAADAGTNLPSLPALPGTTPLPGPTGLPGTTPPKASNLTPEASFGANPGGLAMFVHAPSSLRPGAPVVVALHGCTQTASAYAAAGWNDLADELGFLVVYAEQSSANNAQRCFRWWEPAHTARDRGEAASIAAMVQSARNKYGVRDAYVTGLSAGGAMTAVMLAAYPDVFRAGAIMSGIPFHCAESQVDAYSCMTGKDKPASTWSALLPAATRENTPRVSIWHGDADYVVRPTNATQLVRQWTGAHHIAENAKTTERVGNAEHAMYRDGKGNVAVESWLIPGMSHGVALDPKGDCGTAGAFMLDVALCSTRRAAAFFGVGSTSTSATSATTSTTSAPDCD